MAYITITAPSDIVYVAGTINGADTVWEEINGKWYGNADASEDSIYIIWVEMYDAAGNRSEYTDSLYYELPYFVTDRTADDVARRTPKGVLNAKDINRIEKNNRTIGDLIAVVMDTKYDWTVGEIPRASDYARIRAQVQKLRDYAHRSTTPEVPGSPLNHYQKYNDIEQIQKDCLDIYDRNKKDLVYAGEMYAGERSFI